jgi:hypothetical protein
LPPLTSFGPIKCAASNARLQPTWRDYGVEFRRAFEGDVVLVEALAETGAYAEVEDENGRGNSLYAGDLFVAVLGNRESSKYLCGSVPEEGIELVEQPLMHLLSNGGIVGVAEEAPAYLAPALPVRCHGVLTRDGLTVNTIRRARARGSGSGSPDGARPPIVLVAASGTDAGKTTLTSRLIASLVQDHAMTVGAAKLAGTGCLEDILQHCDAGARWVADFPDVGLPSTYTDPERYETAARALLDLLSAKGPDVIVAELGGDLIWANIPTLLRMSDVMGSVIGLVVIPTDVLSAIGTEKVLREWGVTADVTWVMPPTRNPVAFRMRMDAYVPGELIDARSISDIRALAARLAIRVAAVAGAAAGG